MVGIPGGCRTLLSSPAPLRGGGRLGSLMEMGACTSACCFAEPGNSGGANWLGGARPEEKGGPYGKGGGAIWKRKGPIKWGGQEGGGARVTGQGHCGGAGIKPAQHPPGGSEEFGGR